MNQLNSTSEPVLSAADSLSIDDPDVVAAVNAYLTDLERGLRPSRQQLLSRFPHLARPLERCLDSLDFMHLVCATAWLRCRVTTATR